MTGSEWPGGSRWFVDVSHRPSAEFEFVLTRDGTGARPAGAASRPPPNLPQGGSAPVIQAQRVSGKPAFRGWMCNVLSPRLPACAEGTAAVTTVWGQASLRWRRSSADTAGQEVEDPGWYIPRHGLVRGAEEDD